MNVADQFAAYYEAVHGTAPYPWQRRLAAEVLERGWPELLDLPTGSGKTSVLDVALFAMAYAPQAMPRRVFLVVDRRVVVDQAAEHGRRILERLRAGAAPDVASRLRALTGGDEPFAVAVLRGGMPKEDGWVRRPDQPLLASATVDQVGSRLLFRGYGVSERMAPVHAGLLGSDTLFLLDEVHLARPFAQTVAAVARQPRGLALPRPPRVVRMSATPGDREGRVFQLDAEDRGDPRLARRLSARKPARLVEVRVVGEEPKRAEHFALALAKEAAERLADGVRVLAVVVNRVATARAVWQRLSADLAGVPPAADVVLLTGRMRPLDREDALTTHDVLARASGALPRGQRPCPRPLVVVATQCIEAGADLDFDAMVVECASLDALRQRVGRLDRRGELGEAPVSVLMRTDAMEGEDPVYGEAASKTWGWLRAKGDEVDLGVDALALPPPAQALEVHAPVRDAPVLLPSHVDAWAQTSPRPEPDPEVALWLHGPDRGQPEVQVVWRADLLEADLATGAGIDPQARREARARLLAQLSACPPHALESLVVPLSAARVWLAAKGDEAEVSDQLGARTPQARAERGDDSSRGHTALRWLGDDVEVVTAAALRPGDTVVVPAARGGVAAWNWAPSSTEAVRDLGDVAQWRGRGRASLRTSPAVLATFGLPPDVAAQPPSSASDADEGAEVGEDPTWVRVASWLGAAATATPASWPDVWRDILVRLRAPRRPHLVELPHGALLVVAPRDRREPATTEGDDGTFLGRELTLAEHSDDVAQWVARFCQSLDLPAPLAGDLRLAAWLHDVGKADPRFQRWLVGGSEVRYALLGGPLAKSRAGAFDSRACAEARGRANYPAGERHELLSVAMVEGSQDALLQAEDRDLVLHLVGSHHGWCRPFAPALDLPHEEPVVLDHGGLRLAASTRHRLARLDSGVGARFWRLTERYGAWGLAWLEAILRLADHRASEERTA